MRLRDLNSPHRWREIRSRGHPIPDLVQVAPHIGLERLDRLPIHPRCAPVRFHLLPRLPDRPLRDIERLVRCFQRVHATPSSRPNPALIERTPSRTTRPLRSDPITGPSPLLRASPPARPATGTLTPPPTGPGLDRNDSPLPPRQPRRCIRTRLLQFHSNAADRAHATFMPDAPWPVSGMPARLIPGPRLRPGFDVT